MRHIATLELNGIEYQIFFDDEDYFARRVEIRSGILLIDDLSLNEEIARAENDADAIRSLIDWVMPEDDFEELWIEEDMTYA